MADRRDLMKYPGGIRKRNNFNKQPSTNLSNTYSNRGMNLEEDINSTNEFYLESNKAVIHKKPTPIQIVNVHYPKRSAAVITEAYFQAKSTTDFNGVYQGKYIDFEAKETRNKTLFPLANIHEHQFEHMQSVIDQGGISFGIIRFTTHKETYFIKSELLLLYWKQMLKGGGKSIPYSIFQKEGWLIPFKYQARVDYLKIIDQLYF